MRTVLWWTGLVLMAFAYIAAGVNHFVNPGFYISIMPLWFPWPAFWVAVSGVAEIVLGAALLVPATRAWAARLIIAMLVVFFIVHIDMLVTHGERFASTPYGFLVARIPLQFVLIAWAAVYAKPRALFRRSAALQ